jgi:hypothetical protein
MMDPSSTSTITEFATVVAGFTGLVIAIGSSDGVANPLVKFRTLTMLFYAFTAAFGSLLPTVFEALEVPDPWRGSAAALTCLLLMNILATFWSSRVILTVEERVQLATWMWALVVAGNGVFALALATALFAGPAVPLAGAVFSALVWQLVLSTILFTRLVMSM